MLWIRGCLLALTVWVTAPGISHGMMPPVRELSRLQVLGGVDSVRAHTLRLLTQGRVPEALEYWVLSTGKAAPQWLLAFKAAFDSGNQLAGRCREVASVLHAGFFQLGGKPELVELRTSSAREFPYILFRLANGKDVNVSRTGYHVLVRLNGRAYDAYTGATGLPWEEYLHRLGARSELTQKVVATLVEQAP